MSYVVRQTETKDLYMIWDNSTDTPIELELNKQAANDMARKLNLGTGFEGHIPTFVARRI